MQRWARTAGAEKQNNPSHAQNLNLARGAKECHHIRWVCDNNQTKCCLTQGLRPWSQHWVEKKSEEASRARVPSSGLSITRTCANDTSVASSTGFDESALGRSSFSNVEVHALMSDAWTLEKSCGP